MRLVGFALLVGGFLWLCWNELAPGAVQRGMWQQIIDGAAAVGDRRDSTVTRQDAAGYAISSVRNFAILIPSSLPAGLMMLAGGLALAVRTRGKPTKL